MENVINCPSKQSAIDCCVLLRRYYPRDKFAIVNMHGNWGYVHGKTMAKINRVIKQGFPVFIVNFTMQYNFIAN